MTTYITGSGVTVSTVHADDCAEVVCSEHGSIVEVDRLQDAYLVHRVHVIYHSDRRDGVIGMRSLPFAPEWSLRLAWAMFAQLDRSGWERS